MPRPNEPSANPPQPTVSVRRAVSVPAPAVQPEPDLDLLAAEPAAEHAPRPATTSEKKAAAGKRAAAGETTKAEPATSKSASGGTPEAEPATSKSAADGLAPDAPAPDAPAADVPSAGESATSEPAAVKTGSRKSDAADPATDEPDGPGPGATAKAAAEADEPAVATATAVAVAAADGGAGERAAAAAAAAPGRPRGPVLAAAGIAGALLLAVPFLVMASDDDSDNTVHTEAAGGMTLAPGPSDNDVAGYLAESPSSSPSPSASPSAEKKDTARKVAAVPDTAPASSEPAAEKTKKTTKAKTEKAAAPSARDRANSASSQSRVLLKNVATGQCADVPAYGNGKVDGPVNQYPCNGTSGDNQLWDLVAHKEAGSGPEGSVLFLVRNSKDGLCMDLPNYGAAAAGTRITEYPCQATKNDNQFWWLDPRSDGTYWIRNQKSRDLCLNVAGTHAGNDAALQIGTCSDGSDDDTHWYFSG
ncbi:RICIN domain-containing protein [Streptomyces sp. NPDC059785]|uniref:RICIN domain-containing protein n=1 Tax=Streptomyces sp. NPDC059785 TaxID=3346945 RepID=UPI003659C805